jgi:hypothetical protein
MAKKKWYTVKDGKIDQVQITREGVKPLPENLKWLEAPPDAELHPETPVERYEKKTMRYLDDQEWLKKHGRKDQRGRWYNKETREQKLVMSIEESVDEAVYTRDAPIGNEPYQFFDETEKCWTVDEEKKEEAAQETALAQKNAEIKEANDKRVLAALAILEGTATEEDIQINEECKAKIIELKQEVKTLELKSEALKLTVEKRKSA